jgi:hypothetical protein
MADHSGVIGFRFNSQPTANGSLNLVGMEQRLKVSAIF